MSRTTVAITSLSNSAVTAKPALTAITTPADGMRIAAGGLSDNLVVELSITTSGSSSAAISVAAGDKPPAFRSGIGALTYETSGSASDARYMLTFESARHADTSGNIDIDFAAVVTAGSAAAYRLPSGL